MASPPDDTASREALTRAVASLEEVLRTLRDDARAYAAIAFVEVVIDRQAGNRSTDALPRPAR